ncbi:MAG: hypothetical protein ACRCS9_08865 [Hyphomicrobium sp.]
MDLDRPKLRAWLTAVLESTGETPTALARKAGLAQSTLTRFLNSDDSPNLSLRSVAKIAHAAGMDPPGIAASIAPRATQPGRGNFSSPDAAPYQIDETDTFDLAIKTLLSTRRAADAWTLSSTALVTAGYLPGDILLVDLNATPKAGDVVCAQAYRWNEGRAETVFRIFEPPYLVSTSADPAVRKPLLVDNDRVIIKGVVVGMLRRHA